MFKCCARSDNEGIKFHPKKIKIVKDVNDDDMLILRSSGEVLEVHERGKYFIKGYSENNI